MKAKKHSPNLPPLKLNKKQAMRIISGEKYRLIITSTVGVKDKEAKMESVKIVFPEE